MHVCVRRGALYLRTRQAYLDDIQMWYVKSPEPGLPYPKQFRDTGGLQAFTHMGEACGVFAEDIYCKPEWAGIFRSDLSDHAPQVRHGVSFPWCPAKRPTSGHQG